MKKLLPQGKLFKKILVILCLISGLVIFAFVAFDLYIYLRSNLLKVNPKDTSITYSDISPESTAIKETTVLANLQVLPSVYDTLVKNFGDFSSHELTTYLRYSEVLKDSNLSNITEGYSYLKEKDLPLLVTQEYIDQYFLSQISNISSQLNQSTIHLNNGSSTFDELRNCIATNIDSFLSNTSCMDQIQKIEKTDVPPTLEYLVDSLTLTSSNSQNDFDKYVTNQKYIYQLVKRKQISQTDVIPSAVAQYDMYLELNQDHILKLDSIIKYLTLVYTQLRMNNTNVNNEITNLANLLNQLKQYEYGNDVPEAILSWINKDALNVDTSNDIGVKANPTISFLVKSIDINNETKTFVAPMYIFTGVDSSTSTSLSFEINDSNFNEDYDVPPASQSKGTVRIPIFMYHQIATAPNDKGKFQTGLYVDPYDFEVEMAYLVKKNYKTVNSLEYYNLLKARTNPKQKTVMITFDDGIENQYINAYPILKKYHLTGVFFVVAHKSSITLSQRREMSKNGMDIDSHSSTHLDLTKVSNPTQLSYEIVSSRYAIEATTGKTVYSFAYPGCVWNSQTLSYVASAGYTLGMSCGKTIDNRFSDKLVLSRVHAFGDLKSFKKLLSGVH